MDITYRKPAAKILRRMQPKRAQMIRDDLALFAADPKRTDVDVVDLTNRPGFRLRSGDWRVIFELTEDRLVVLRISPRGQVYKD
ncbi:MAG: type II toxin-antitoxin system RelE/ParE family toxin [Rhodospirillales bacterium]|nr:type II toxin-antitoxin system RelE/ParE family toxin [Rhodospirillales bacterium]